MGPPVTRTAKKMATQSSSSTNLEASSSSQDLQDNDAAPLDPFQVGDLSEEPQDATPRRNQQPRGNQPQRQRAEGPDLEDVLTQLTQEILTLCREAIAHQPQQPQNVEVPEDPNFNWNLLKLPAETNFPVPCTSLVQHIAADLLARLPSLVARDQHDARFVLAVISE